MPVNQNEIIRKIKAILS